MEPDGDPVICCTLIFHTQQELVFPSAASGAGVWMNHGPPGTDRGCHWLFIKTSRTWEIGLVYLKASIWMIKQELLCTMTPTLQTLTRHQVLLLTLWDVLDHNRLHVCRHVLTQSGVFSHHKRLIYWSLIFMGTLTVVFSLLNYLCYAMSS